MKKEKTEIITMRIKPQYKQEIQRKAKQAQLTVTNYLTLCGMRKKLVQIQGLDELLTELKAQVRNLNRLTTLANRASTSSGVFFSSNTCFSLFQIGVSVATILEKSRFSAPNLECV